MTETTGYIAFHYHGETFKTWYKLVGEIKSGGPTPIVVLHGGPGIPSPYLDPFEDLNASLHIPIIFYDQVGCGKSTHLKDKPASFWTVEDELDNVIDHFGIASSFNLLGHSWGGMLAADYITSRRPAGLTRLVLVSTLASVELWTKCVGKLLAQMPSEAQEAIHKHEAQGTIDDPEYKKWTAVFYNKHLCTVDPWPESLVKAFESFEEDPTVYQTMYVLFRECEAGHANCSSSIRNSRLGPSEFTVTGSLMSWSVVGKLDAIKVPTLITNGIEDEAQDEVFKPFVDEVPDIKWVKFEKSSHMAFHEEREAYMKVVSNFLA